MRKNTARHWLHATLDLLPVILIPVFMIYSHRHDLSTDITIQQDAYKDFYQGVRNGKPNNLDYISSDNNLFLENNYLKYEYNEDSEIIIDFDFELNINNNDYIYTCITLFGNENEYNVVITIDDFTNELITIDNVILDSDTKFSNLVQIDYTIESLTYFCASSSQNGYIKDFQLFNLTTIFGSGNEPTKEVFESYLTQDYYDFGSNEVKVGTIDVQAKNNDIMSVFMDSFNNSVNKYFNMGNVFNLNNVYEWFNANLFGGNAPVVIYSVYNIVVYELVMDLLFLLYALFMWFIDMLKRLIEKPLDSIK